MKKKGGKIMENGMILTDLEQDKKSTFQTQGTPLLATKLSVQHNFI